MENNCQDGRFKSESMNVNILTTITNNIDYHIGKNKT